jgi:hypothetical protein
MTLSIKKLCHYVECHCAECRNLFIGMLIVIMLSAIMLNVVMLRVVAPIRDKSFKTLFHAKYNFWVKASWHSMNNLGTS